MAPVHSLSTPHRYNQIVSRSLADIVYDPIIQGRWLGRAEQGLRPPAAHMPPLTEQGNVMSTPGLGGSFGEGGGGGGVGVRQRKPCITAAAPACGPGEAVAVGRGPRPRVLLAQLAAFTVSGLMHEVIIW